MGNPPPPQKKKTKTKNQWLLAERQAAIFCLLTCVLWAQCCKVLRARWSLIFCWFVSEQDWIWKAFQFVGWNLNSEKMTGVVYSLCKADFSQQSSWVRPIMWKKERVRTIGHLSVCSRHLDLPWVDTQVQVKWEYSRVSTGKWNIGGNQLCERSHHAFEYRQKHNDALIWTEARHTGRLFQVPVSFRGRRPRWSRPILIWFVVLCPESRMCLSELIFHL